MKKFISILLMLLLITVIMLPISATMDGETYYNSGETRAEKPYVIYDDISGYYYAYTSEDTKGYHFSVKKSADMVSWEPVGGILEKKSNDWANDWYSSPEVYYNQFTGKYFLFYSARIKAGTGRAESHFGDRYYAEACKIGVAVSSSPAGPFNDIKNAPIEFFPYDPQYYNIDKIMPNSFNPPSAKNISVEQGTYLSMSDPHLLFDDSGKIYMYFTRGSYRNWKWDSELSKYIRESEICCVELTSDWWNDIGGTTAPSVADTYLNSNKSETDSSTVRKDGYVTILSHAMESQVWENGDVNSKPYSRIEIENPEIIKSSYDIDSDGTNEQIYYLFYTCNGKNSLESGIGYAVLTSPLGAANKYDQNPILASEQGMSMAGYGNIAFSPDKTEYYMNYHANVSGKGSKRLLSVKMSFGAVDSDTGVPSVTVGNGLGDQSVPSGTAPYTIRLNNAFGSVETGKSKKMSYEILTANGGKLKFDSKAYSVTATSSDTGIVRVSGLSNGAVDITGISEGRTSITLTFRRKKADGTLGAISAQADIPVSVSDIEVSEIDQEIYQNENFSFNVTTDPDVTDLRLYNERNSTVSIISLTSENVSGKKVWTVTTKVGTAGENRNLKIFAKTNGEYYDTYASVAFNVMATPARVYSMEFTAESVAVNSPVNVVIVTNNVVNGVRITNQKGGNMGKTLVSKTIRDDGKIEWVYTVSFGTPGENRIFIAYAGINNVYNVDFTASDSITVTAE